ncbi:unnamed protein product [Owenia fusiformis]|uniref:Serine/arginine-rich splicing factor 7 n=1 Tax=Owenia fusiformis TaxID=6347 RepID=A0A8S4P2X7_OWEFU|nr:unnamed protein product [Owenia fusiformis]
MGRSRSRSRSRSRDRDRGRKRSYSRSRSRSRSPSEDGHRVHVADLGMDCSKHELERAFDKYGDIVEIWLARNPPCFAFIVYKNKDDADEAIKEMDGEIVCGGRIKVSFARPRVRGGRSRRIGGGGYGGYGGGGGGGGGRFDPSLKCYQCGRPGHFSRECRSFRSRLV